MLLLSRLPLMRYCSKEEQKKWMSYRVCSNPRSYEGESTAPCMFIVAFIASSITPVFQEATQIDNIHIFVAKTGEVFRKSLEVDKEAARCGFPRSNERREEPLTLHCLGCSG